MGRQSHRHDVSALTSDVSLLTIYRPRQIKAKKRSRAKRIRIKFFDTFSTISPIIPFRPRQIKDKRRTKSRKLKLIKFENFGVVTFTPYSVFYEVLKPYLLKQFIPRWIRRVKIKRRFNAKYGTPKYQTWRSVITVMILQPIAVKVTLYPRASVSLPKSYPELIPK